MKLLAHAAGDQIVVLGVVLQAVWFYLEADDPSGGGRVLFIIIMHVSIMDFNDYFEVIVNKVLLLDISTPFRRRIRESQLSPTDREALFIMSDPASDVVVVESLSPGGREVVDYSVGAIFMGDHPNEVFVLLASDFLGTEDLASGVFVHEDIVRSCFDPGA